MNILSLLDYLEDELEKATAVPFMGKNLVDCSKCLDIIKDIRLNLPDAIKQAELIKNERQRILADAQKEAETIIQEAEKRIQALVDENEISRRAYAQAQDIVSNAKESAKEIRLGAKEYAEEVLEKVEKYLEKTLSVVKENHQELRGLQK